MDQNRTWRTPLGAGLAAGTVWVLLHGCPAKEPSPADPAAYLNLAEARLTLLKSQYATITGAFGEAEGDATRSALRKALEEARRTEEESRRGGPSPAAVPAPMSELAGKLDRARDLFRQAIEEMLAYWEAKDGRVLTGGLTKLQLAAGLTNECAAELSALRAASAAP